MNGQQIVAKEEIPLEVLRPVGTNEQIVKAWRDFQALKQVLLTDEDFYEPVQGKSVIRKSGWRKMAVAFGLSDEILNQTQEISSDGKDWTWRIRVRITSRGGRSVEALGACSSKERRFAHAEHDTYAMAHTRAKSRAIADMLGSSEQLEEEVEDQTQPPKPQVKPIIDEWTSEQLIEELRKREY